MVLPNRTSSSAACCCNPTDICYLLKECDCGQSTPCDDCPDDGVFVSKMAFEWIVKNHDLDEYVIQLGAGKDDRCCVYADETTSDNEYSVEEVNKLDDFLLIYSESEDPQDLPIQKFNNIEICTSCLQPSRQCAQYCGLCESGKVCGNGVASGCAASYALQVDMPEIQLYSMPYDGLGNCDFITDRVCHQGYSVPARSGSFTLIRNPTDHPSNECAFRTVSSPSDEAKFLSGGWTYGGSFGGQWIHRMKCSGCSDECSCCSICCLKGEVKDCTAYIPEHLEHCTSIPDWDCPLCSATRLMGWAVRIKIRPMDIYCDPDGSGGEYCIGNCCSCDTQTNPIYDCCEPDDPILHYEQCTELPCTNWRVELDWGIMTNACFIPEKRPCSLADTIQCSYPPPYCPPECMNDGYITKIHYSKYWIRVNSCSCPDACSSSDAHCVAQSWSYPQEVCKGDCDSWSQVIRDPMFWGRTTQVVAGMNWSIS